MKTTKRKNKKKERKWKDSRWEMKTNGSEHAD